MHPSRLIGAALFGLVIGAQATPVHLRTNALDRPLGLDTPRPVFSWRSDEKRPNWMQAGYEIVVATSPAALSSKKPDVWDSGRVASSESVDVRFAGPALKPQERYVWAVRTWDERGRMSTSMPTWFETGLMGAGAWKGQWIGRKDAAGELEVGSLRWIWLPGSDAMHVASATPAHFRYRLRLAGAPAAASLHLMVRGQFTARVNGKVTGHHDEWGAFDREEMTGLLHAGDNEIEVDVVSHKTGKAGASSPAAMAASIHVTDAAGKEMRIVSDASWQTRAESTGQWASAQVVGPMSLSFGLGTDRQKAVPGPDRVATDASLFRKDFRTGASVRSARLSVTALGAYQAFLDGKAVAPNTLLAPGWTDFHKRVLYQTYDVTPLVKKGANTLGIQVGGGWYSSPLTWAGYRDTPGPNLVRAQLDLTYEDGRHETVATDESWLSAASPISFSEIYGGESYDARLAQAGWNDPGFAGQGWMPAVAGAPVDPGMVVTAQPDLPINTTMTVKPVSLAPASAAHPAIYDMGQNMVGNIRIHVSGARGTVLRLRYAERLNPDGGIYTENLRNADATDTYTLAGTGEETWSPAFTFHGFRYVEFAYLGASTNAAPTLATIEGLVFNSLPAVPSVRLSSSSEVLNKMNELGAWGQRGNFVSIPTDCPQRDERLGWMGDAGVFWRTGSFNFDIDAFTHKFMDDVIDAQTPAGAFTDVSPNILGPNPGAPGWGDAGVFIPYAAWLQYGDKTIVEQSWPAMERWMSFIAKSNPDHLRRKMLGNNYADWLAPDEKTPKDLIGTAYWALIAREMVEMAKAIHHDEDAARYQKEYEAIAQAYREAYIKPDGSVSGNTQAAYLATVFTGIAPEGMRAGMVDRVVKDVRAHGNHLTTGFLGTPFLLSVLDENNKTDAAFDLLLSDTYPSWGYMVKKGATTWWERWNGDTGDPGMNSYNHYAFGSVMAWVYRRAAGIDTDAAGAGYHHLVIHPHFDPRLPKLHTEYDSAYGTVISDWDGGAHRFTITLPPNTTGTVLLPKEKEQTIGAGVHAYQVKAEDAAR